MHKKWTSIVLAAAWLAAPLCSAAQQTVSASADSQDSDEVVVRATRLYELRAAIVATEDRFFARYNELNKVDDFDIECTVQAPTGTRFKKRTCRLNLQAKAERDYARDYMQWLQDLGDGVITTALPSDPNVEVQVRYEEYKRNVLYLLKMNPELRRLVRERDDAEKRYNTERKKHAKGRLIQLY